MKSKTVALTFALAASVIGLSLGLLAADKKPANPPLKKPTLKVDSSQDILQ